MFSSARRLKNRHFFISHLCQIRFGENFQNLQLSCLVCTFPSFEACNKHFYVTAKMNRPYIGKSIMSGQHYWYDKKDLGLGLRPGLFYLICEPWYLILHAYIVAYYVYCTSECPRSEDRIFKLFFNFLHKIYPHYVVQFKVFVIVHKVYTIFLSVSMFRMSCHPLCTWIASLPCGSSHFPSSGQLLRRSCHTLSI